MTQVMAQAKTRHIGIGTFRASLRAKQLVGQVLESGQLSYGKLSKSFEMAFSELHGCRYGVLSNSGTSSLHVALQAMKELRGWKDGDYVAVPAMTFVATANIVIHNRMRPLFVDVRYDDYGMDAEGFDGAGGIELEGGGELRAVIPVHLFGQPCDMTSVLQVAAAEGLEVIEDSCETCFASHLGKQVGSMGAIGCFSLYNAHILTAGVGGVATTNDPDLALRMRSLVNHGLDPEELNLDDNFSPRPTIGRSFRFRYTGHSFRITEMEAALALAQIEDWQTIVRMRRRNAAHLSAQLSRLNDLFDGRLRLPTTKPGNTHSWMMYPIVVRPGKASKAGLTKHLNAHGIETRDMMPILGQPIFDWIDRKRFPVADDCERNGFYVGIHQNLVPDDIDFIAECFEGYLRGLR